MKKITLTSAIFMALAATGVFAHHPAADVVSEETYDMITENLGDSPHLTMEIYNMGSAAGIEAGSSAMEQAERSLEGFENAQYEPGGTSREQPQEPQADTMVLMEDVDDALAE